MRKTLVLRSCILGAGVFFTKSGLLPATYASIERVIFIYVYKIMAGAARLKRYPVLFHFGDGDRTVIEHYPTQLIAVLELEKVDDLGRDRDTPA